MKRFDLTTKDGNIHVFEAENESEALSLFLSTLLPDHSPIYHGVKIELSENQSFPKKGGEHEA